MREFYKTSYLAKTGKFILVTIFLLLVAGKLLIPEFEGGIDKQPFSVKGICIKYDDNPAVRDFFNAIRSNNGVLVLGTSETTEVTNGNYYDFLNSDHAMKTKFSLLAGAGRTCGLYIPLFLKHVDELNGLKLIYFINPVYWRTDLCKVSTAYWNRYSIVNLCNSVSGDENARYFGPVREYVDKLNFLSMAGFSAEYYIRKIRESYFNHLNFIIDPDLYNEQFVYYPESSSLNNFENFGKIDLRNIDTVWNIDKSFKNKEWFKSIDKSVNYRYEELTAFVRLCKDLKIDATFIVGPYNQRFIEKYSPGDLPGYIEVTENIKKLLDGEGARYIDATDISNVAGTFIDHQHHSSYGAYLIYLKIKEQYQ
ncbi:MAG: hypothetical protein A2W91_03910 [Bacteroidetes bacterium GWF2_38_335]|nr:MAG: hypothetical protein A2W91_03910 [Bacteroidetes bacterium GWF2_38_335]OFY79098.1 MAG: hypothetical protein A2281_03245 [Bacteroidetes bacterium RIFOXYA12_FULL_38_20]HBS88818.1 hypothetical protein [Bacteroidales bacterium]